MVTYKGHGYTCHVARSLGPVGGLGAVATDWLGEQPGSQEQGRDLQAARRPGWAASVGSVSFIGLIDCCSLQHVGSPKPT